MTIVLAILKWIGIVLLILLAVVILILLLVLLVPFRYHAEGHVRDPEEHEDIPFETWKNGADVSAEVTWLLHFLRARIRYPSQEKLEVWILGRPFPVERFLKKKEPPQEEEKKEEEPAKEPLTLPQKIEQLVNKADQAAYGVDYYYRTLTGICGRRALDAVLKRLDLILQGILPSRWYLKGTVGLGDPYREGKLYEVCSILSPFTGDSLAIDNVWLAWQMDLSGSLSGILRLGRIVRGVFPLLFDKNCKKLLRKLRAGKAKIKAYGAKAEAAPEAVEGGQNG